MAKHREEEKILDINASMQGNLVFSESVNLRIDGNFEGNLKVKGILTIGSKAKAKADIEGDTIIIAGYVKGRVNASKIISLTSSANVDADISAPQISIEEGAVFNGKCKMQIGRASCRERV